MMFEILMTEEADSIFADLKKHAERALSKNLGKNPPPVGLFKQVKKTMCLLSQNPRHPGLHTHEYSGLPNPWDAKQKVFEAYVQNRTPGAYRLFWCYGPEKNQITVITILKHP
ncbi:MAG: hypothetical protein KDK60_03015 [Chlamydiia bacterium]|nr:hypothetical protein [Chlamydiia bacterium]